MVPVVAGGIVALSPHTLDVKVRAPALESAGAILQTPNCVVTGEQGTVGKAFRRVHAFRLAIVDDRWCIPIHAFVFRVSMWNVVVFVIDLFSTYLMSRIRFASFSDTKFSMYMIKGARDSKWTRYPSASGHVNGTPSSGLMKLSSVRLMPGPGAPLSSKRSSSVSVGSRLGKNPRRSGSMTKRYIGMKYRAQVMSVEIFGMDAIGASIDSSWPCSCSHGTGSTDSNEGLLGPTGAGSGCCSVRVLCSIENKILV